MNNQAADMDAIICNIQISYKKQSIKLKQAIN